jgi:hypothetical protein
MKFDSKDKIEIFENSISWIVVFAMFVYGGAKIAQFDGAATINKTVSAMSGIQLMWAFYGYSKAYAVTLGVFEIVGGVLILIKRTRIIGCLFTSTLLINVILQDVYFGVSIGALKAAILYELIILIILWLHKDKLIQSIKTLMNLDNWEQPKSKFITKYSIAFICFILLRITEYFVTK